MKKRIMPVVKSLAAMVVVVAFLHTTTKAQDQGLGGDGFTQANGCKFTGIISDYCVFGHYNVLNCVNNTETSNCGFN